MSCPNVTNNSNLLEGKPRESTVLKNLIDSINAIIQDDLIDPVCDIEEQTSILTATGIWLDYIGERLGFPRPLVVPNDYIWFGFDGNGYGFDQANFYPGADNIGIDDDSYRAILIIRGGQLLTDCSLPSLVAILRGVFKAGNYIDNGNMSMDIIIDNTQTDIIIKILTDSGIITKPAGVQLTNFLISHTDGTFGFDGNGVGFDQGNFVRTLDDLVI